MAALAAKITALRRRGLDGSIMTQFGFDPAAVLTWLADLRARGITVPVRVGVPGPAAPVSCCGTRPGAASA